MGSLTTRERFLPSVVSSAIYTLGFPFTTHFLRGGEWFGCFVVIPLFLIACHGGEWMGLIAAGVAIVYTDAILAAQHVIIHHESLSSSRVLPLVLCELTLLLLAPIAGRIGRMGRAFRSSTATFEAALRMLPDTVFALDRQGKVPDVWHEAKQTLSPTIVDVDASIEESLEMMRGMLGEGITVVHEAGAEASLVKVDPGQFTQVLANLAINARDAMPSGGRLAVKVHRVAVASADAGLPTEMHAGDYVVIQVSDTGTGMDQETTKGLGSGTGLGLSIVSRVVKQSAGHISVDSRVGKGTTVSIYLPRVFGARETRGKHESCPAEEQSGTETILLVEDEEQVSNLIQRCLSGCGYQVLPAGDGKTGLEICRQKSGQIHLLLVDVTLPDIRGDKVAQEFRATNPRGRVVFMTGYSDVVGLTKERVLNKPFTLSDLAVSIRRELDSR